MTALTPLGSANTPTIALVVDSRQRRNRFGRYAGEILRAEGIGDFQEIELRSLEGEQGLQELRRFGVVLLTNCGAVPGLEALLGQYVEGGGRLIMSQPAVELASLAGLEPLYQARTNAGLLIDSTSPVFGGFPYEPLQIVGAVDLYRAAAGTTVIARTVAGDWPVEPFPVIVERAAGLGRVLSFLYDIPHTVARLRQGDPTLAEVDSDGLVGVRPSDAIQWQIDPRVGMIPQAEIHQAMLARAVESLCPWPLPRVWYLPGEAQSILILTGDLCSDRSDDWLLEEAALAERYGCTLGYYLHEKTIFKPENAARLSGAGHAVSIHPFAVPFSAPHMDTTLGRHLETFHERYGLRPRTVRHHRLQWLGWAEQAKLEAKHGLELDLNFTTARPLRNGYLFGAGRPIRFVDETGEVIGVWQQPTQFEDDLILGDHEISLRIDTAEACALYDALLDGAIRQWHTAIAVNLHPGNYMRYSGDWGRHLVATTSARGVPIWNPERWLDFTRDRSALCIRRPTGSTGHWRVDVPDGAGSRDLVLLVPERFGDQSLQEPSAGQQVELFGWRYRGVPLKGAPAALELAYAYADGH